MATVKDLYRITEGDAVYRFTSSNEVEYVEVELLLENGDSYITEGGVLLIGEIDDDYPPRVVGRGEVKDTANYLKDTLDVTLPLRDTLSQHFIASPIDFKARLELMCRQADGSITVEWRGTLNNTKPNMKECVLTWNSAFASNRTAGRRPFHSRTCRHALYGPKCTMQFDDWKNAGGVTGVSPNGLTVTVPEAALLADGYLNGGVLKMEDGTMRYIRSHVGAVLGLTRASPSLAESIAANAPDPAPVEFAPGCLQSLQYCTDVFENEENYGGFPLIPLNNPMGSAIV